MDGYDILVRIPEYAEAQIEAGDTLRPVSGHHKIVETRRMQVVADEGHQLRAFDGHHEVVLSDVFVAAFATRVERPKPRSRRVKEEKAESATTTEATPENTPESSVSESATKTEPQAAEAADGDELPTNGESAGK